VQILHKPGCNDPGNSENRIGATGAAADFAVSPV